MIVFGRNRQVGCEADLDAGPDHAAPSRPAALIEWAARRRGDAFVLVVGDGTATLHVPEYVVPGITDLACKQADCVGLALIGCAGSEQARIAALEVGPVALRHEAEDTAAGLPSIADLTAAQGAGRMMTTLSSTQGSVGPAVACRATASVRADV